MPDTDPRLVGALVFHNCTTGDIHSWTTEVLKQIFVDSDCAEVGNDTYVNLTCWDLIECEQSTDEPDACWNPDPCAMANELRCCMMSWAKDGKKKSWSFRDRSGSISYLSEDKLCQLLAEAESECEMQCGINNRCLTLRCGVPYCG